MKSVELMRTDTERHQHLQSLIHLFKSELKLKKWQLMPSITAIQPILVGSNQAALNLSEFLLSRGILVPAIRPPTVPKNTARLRVSISAGHTVEDIHQLMNALHEAEELL